MKRQYKKDGRTYVDTYRIINALNEQIKAASALHFDVEDAARGLLDGSLEIEPRMTSNLCPSASLAALFVLLAGELQRSLGQLERIAGETASGEPEGTRTPPAPGSPPHTPSNPYGGNPGDQRPGQGQTKSKFSEKQSKAL